VRFSGAPKIRQGAPGKFKGALICVFFGARHFWAHSWASEFSRKKSQKICKNFEKIFFRKTFFLKKKCFFARKLIDRHF